MDTGPVPRQVRAALPRRCMPTDNFGVAELAMAGIKYTAQQTVRLVKTVPALASALVGLVRAGRESNREADGGKAPRTNWFAPRTPINVSVTNQRLFASFSLPLDGIKTIAKGNGVSLNDVVLAICSGALRHYLADRGCVPSDALLAAVPVSLREAGNTDLNNQVSMILETAVGRARVGCDGGAGKAERCGSKCARARLDSAKKASLWLDCGLQGRRRCGLLSARRSNAASARQRGPIGCGALSPVR